MSLTTSHSSPRKLTGGDRPPALGMTSSAASIPQSIPSSMLSFPSYNSSAATPSFNHFTNSSPHSSVSTLSTPSILPTSSLSFSPNNRNLGQQQQQLQQQQTSTLNGHYNPLSAWAQAGEVNSWTFSTPNVNGNSPKQSHGFMPPPAVSNPLTFSGPPQQTSGLTFQPNSPSFQLNHQQHQPLSPSTAMIPPSAYPSRVNPSGSNSQPGSSYNSPRYISSAQKKKRSSVSSTPPTSSTTISSSSSSSSGSALSSSSSDGSSVGSDDTVVFKKKLKRFDPGYVDDDVQEAKWDLKSSTDLSFLALIDKFAQFASVQERNDNKEENCPICAAKFPLFDFAEHVYVCIRKFDEDEKAIQEKQDEEYARKLQEQDANSMKGENYYGQHEVVHHRARLLPAPTNGDEMTGDIPHRTESEMSEEGANGFGGNDANTTSVDEMDTGRRTDATSSKEKHNKKWAADLYANFNANFQRPASCRNGRSCKIRYAQHFIDVYHPPVACPICNQEFEMYEMDAHVMICLDTPPAPQETPLRPSADANRTTNSPPQMLANIHTANGFQFQSESQQSSSSLPSSSSASSSSASSALPQTSKFSSLRSPQTMKSPALDNLDDFSQPAFLQSDLPDDDPMKKVLNGITDDDDDDVKEENTDEYQISPSTSLTSASESAGGAVERTPSSGLSFNQASLMARFLSTRKKNDMGTLLNRFKDLGFTQENLSALLAEKENEQSKQTRIASPSPFTSVPANQLLLQLTATHASSASSQLSSSVSTAVSSSSSSSTSSSSS